MIVFFDFFFAHVFNFNAKDIFVIECTVSPSYILLRAQIGVQRSLSHEEHELRHDIESINVFSHVKNIN